MLLCRYPKPLTLMILSHKYKKDAVIIKWLHLFHLIILNSSNNSFCISSIYASTLLTLTALDFIFIPTKIKNIKLNITISTPHLFKSIAKSLGKYIAYGIIILKKIDIYYNNINIR